jgi:tetratricopeptide (TPR) repeat protein
MRSGRRLLISAVLLALLTGCGRTRTGTIPPKEEAVTLMDTRQNAKAAEILETALEKNPDDDEAKLLLASAYMGLAGIDIYRIFDAFQDLIFRRSLKDQIISPARDGIQKHPLGNGDIPSADETKTKAEEAMAAIDRALSSFQLVLLYLDRFPQVPEEKWPYIESALAELESMRDPSSDTFTYRVLIRLIYSKSYLVERVIRDHQAWTRDWGCHFDVRDFDEGLDFFTHQALAIDEELGEGAAKGAKALGKARRNFHFLAEAAYSADAFSAWSAGMTFSELENSLKDAFNCH